MIYPIIIALDIFYMDSTVNVSDRSMLDIGQGLL